jgi:hypothetical protein
MHQVPAHVANEDRAAILGRKGVAGVNGPAGSGGEIAGHLLDPVELVFVIALLPQPGPLDPPLLGTGQRKHLRHGLFVLIGVPGDWAGLEEWRTPQVLRWNNSVTNMNSVLRQKPVAPIVERHAVLSGAGRGLRQAVDGVKPEIGTPYQDGWALGMIGGADSAV